MKGCGALVGAALLLGALFAVWLSLPQSDPAVYAAASRAVWVAMGGVFVVTVAILVAEPKEEG